MNEYFMHMHVSWVCVWPGMHVGGQRTTFEELVLFFPHLR